MEKSGRTHIRTHRHCKLTQVRLTTIWKSLSRRAFLQGACPVDKPPVKHDVGENHMHLLLLYSTDVQYIESRPLNVHQGRYKPTGKFRPKYSVQCLLLLLAGSLFCPLELVTPFFDMFIFPLAVFEKQEIAAEFICCRQGSCDT